MLKYIKEGLLNLIFPINCRICKKPIRESEGYSICKECMKKIELIEGPLCTTCGKPLIHSDYFINHDDSLCLDCKKYNRYFDFARSIGVFNHVLRTSIHLLKYYREKKLVKPLGRLLIEFICKNKLLFQKIDFIIPVPLHKEKIKERGFNQSLLLALEIGNYFNIPVKPDCLIKGKITASQVRLSKTERRFNLKKAFLVKASESLKKKNILLIDDVFTTGSTVSECSKELKNAQVNNIYVLTLARGIMESTTVFP